jgi:transcription initiation factor IIE alpha subunit
MFIRRKIQGKVLEYLEKKGEVMDKELLEVLSKEYNVSYNELLNILMSLEIEGFIRVRPVKESSFIIQKAEQKKQ